MHISKDVLLACRIIGFLQIILLLAESLKNKLLF